MFKVNPVMLSLSATLLSESHHLSMSEMMFSMVLYTLNSVSVYELKIE